jgi:hypothetical protein
MQERGKGGKGGKGGKRGGRRERREGVNGNERERTEETRKDKGGLNVEEGEAGREEGGKITFPTIFLASLAFPSISSVAFNKVSFASSSSV